MESGAEGATVQSVERALDLLEALTNSGESVGVSRLAATTRLRPSTTHRLLTTLVRRGWVERDPRTRRYRIALRAAGRTLSR